MNSSIVYHLYLYNYQYNFIGTIFFIDTTQHICLKMSKHFQTKLNWFNGKMMSISFNIFNTKLYSHKMEESFIFLFKKKLNEEWCECVECMWKEMFHKDKRCTLQYHKSMVYITIPCYLRYHVWILYLVCELQTKRVLCAKLLLMVHSWVYNFYTLLLLCLVVGYLFYSQTTNIY